MSKPDLLKWIPNDDVAKISDPGSTKKAAGFLYKEKVAFQFLNWLFNSLSKWILGLQGGYYGIVVGSAAQVTANEATHVWADLNDALLVAGSKVLLLDGTHTMTASKSFSGNRVVFSHENNSVVDFDSTYTLTFSGSESLIDLRVRNVPSSGIIISGNASKFNGVNVDIAKVIVSNGAIATSSGISGGIKYPDTIHTIEVPIGDWDIPTSNSINVAHGLTGSKIKGVKVLIRNDADTISHDHGYDNSAGTGSSSISVTATNIAINTKTGGFFDSTDFDLTPFNRGSIIIEYID